MVRHAGNGLALAVVELGASIDCITASRLRLAADEIGADVADGELGDVLAVRIPRGTAAAMNSRACRPTSRP